MHIQLVNISRLFSTPTPGCRTSWVNHLIGSGSLRMRCWFQSAFNFCWTGRLDRLDQQISEEKLLPFSEILNWSEPLGSRNGPSMDVLHGHWDNASP